MMESSWIAIIGIIITVVIAVIAGVFWAGNINAKVNTMGTVLTRIEIALAGYSQTYLTKETAQRELDEAERQHKAIWKKIEEIGRYVRACLFKLGINPDTIDKGETK